MAIFKGNVNDLMKLAFGVYSNLPVYIPGNSMPVTRIDSPEAYYEKNGNYLFDRFGFEIAEADLTFTNQTDPTKWYLPETTILDSTISKNMVQTIMAGRKGTVKELVSEGDWIFTFRGLIIGENVEFPRTVRKQMKQVWGINKNMRIYSRLINDLDVHRVVVLDLRFPPLEGYDNVQPFELVCVSDDDIVLNLNAS
jgi:hypothetical protein